jgi:alkanesulfonate monooxygenase SsuD/methylene tetrahydromethanopterin reductase-like flavin-dependent oxidoreductase (luciferase family)
MRYWYFSETSYPYLPDEDSYPSIRVTLPNGLLDPSRAADLWHRYLDEWMVAEEYGFGLMMNEHHSTATCANPAAPVVAGILARITSKAPLLILGNPIANRPDPVRVAEEMALVDVISRGRLEVGFVRSVPYEISATNTYPIAMSERMWEAHDLILKAWTTHDGPFSWTGRFFEHRQVNIWPRPYQQPHPPVWVTTLNPRSAAAIAQRGHTLATFMQGKATKAIFDAYREERARIGVECRPEQLAYCAMVFVGDNEEQIRRGIEQILWYARANKVSPQFQAPPGYMPAKARIPMLSGTGPDASSMITMPVEKMIEEGILFAGNPDTVFEQIKSFYDHVGGFGQLMLMGQAGFLDHEDTVNSIRLFSQEVAPRLNELVPGDQLAGTV